MYILNVIESMPYVVSTKLHMNKNHYIVGKVQEIEHQLKKILDGTFMI